MAYLLVFALMALLAVSQTASEALQPSSGVLRKSVQLQWVFLYGQAAQAYFESHPVDGVVGDEQLSAYLGAWSPLLDSVAHSGVMSQTGLSHGAQRQAGQTYAWVHWPGQNAQSMFSSLPLASDATFVNIRQHLGIAQAGLLTQFDGRSQNAPSGIPDGALVDTP